MSIRSPLRQLAAVGLALTFLAAAPRFTAAAMCGNGVREDAEQCDGNDVGGFTCDDFCGNGGTLGCKSDCTFDLGSCYVCGNDKKDPGEVCDGTDLGGAGPCPQGGYRTCAQDCSQLDDSLCFYCGNGRAEGADACTGLPPGCVPPPQPEECDGGDLAGATCPAPTYHGGLPICLATCTLDYDATVGTQGGCWRCGNGRVEPGEECDGGALNGGATYGCTTACTTRCGDGTVQSNEECDDGNRNNGDGCSALCKAEWQYPGGGGETRDCNVEWGVVGVSPGATNACADGDLLCDADGLVNGACSFTVSYCFNVYPGKPQNPSCTPSNVASYELWGTSLSGANALDGATQTAVLDAIRSTIVLVPGIVVPTSGAVRTVTPALLDLNLCGSTTLTVPVGSARDLDLQVTDSSNAVDQDALSLVCQP